MGFTDKQRAQLGRVPAAAHVRTRERRGQTFCYLEAWRAIEAANRIFGPDGWDRETVEMRCAASKQIGGTLTAAYVARVRVTVHAEGRTIVREGQGCGEGRGDTPFEAHDIGLKAAETDATKRALATFGRAFGLGFYLGERPGGAKAKSRASETDPALAEPRTGANGADAQVNAAALGDVVTPDTDWDPEDPSDDGPNRGSRSSIPQSEGATPGRNDPLIGRTPQRAVAGPTRAAWPSADTPALPAARGTDPPPSGMLIPKERRVRDKDHLRYVASQSCLICDRKPADAHHLRFAQPTAMAKKVSDEFTVPLCRVHHRQLHRDPDERGWWEIQGIEPLEIAEELWKEGRA